MSTPIPVIVVSTDRDGDEMDYNLFTPNGMRFHDYCWALGRLIFLIAEEFEKDPELVLTYAKILLPDVEAFLCEDDDNEEGEV